MDLNHRPPGPEPGALARLRYAPTGPLRAKDSFPVELSEYHSSPADGSGAASHPSHPLNSLSDRFNRGLEGCILSPRRFKSNRLVLELGQPQ